MPRLKGATTFATSKYKGGRQSASVSSGGKIGNKGKFVTRNQRYNDLRRSFGMRAQ